MAREKAASLIVASKVKEYLKKKGFRTSAEALAAVNTALKAALDKAAARTKGNGRNTVKPADI